MSGSNGHSDLARLLLRYPNQEQKEDLKRALRNKNYTQETLIELLSHEIAPTRRAATYTLGVISDAQAVQPLVESLQHEDPGLRSNAEQALWAIWFRSGNESVDAMLKRAQDTLKKEQYEDAIEKLTAVIQVAPKFAEGYNQRAIAYFMQEEWEKSIDDCEQAIALNPYHFGAFAGLGHCYLRLGHLRQAIDAYQRALEVNPNLYAIAHTILQIQVALQEHLEDEEN
jgi:tetratricopeptide (TPR) repeat protein